jgi:hypothetical protein
MYVFNWSESNLLGRGDVAPERGLVGDRMPDNAELAMMAESDGTGAEACLCRAAGVSVVGELLCSVCPQDRMARRVNSFDPVALHSHQALEHHVHHYFSWATLFVITT